MELKNLLKATLVAPWASMVLVVYAFAEHLLSMDAESMELLASQIPGLIYVFILFTLGFVGTAYLIVLVAGLPSHFLLAKLKVRNLTVYLFVGLAIGLLWQYLLLLGSSMPKHLQETGFYSYGISALLVEQ